MPRLSHTVELSEEEIEKLKSVTHKGSGHSARTIMHAYILLWTNDALKEKKKDNRELAEFFDISPTTINQVGLSEKLSSGKFGLRQ